MQHIGLQLQFELTQEERKLDRNTSDDKQTTTSVLKLLPNETVLNDGSVCYCTASLRDLCYDFV